MATFRKTKAGCRAEIFVKGLRESGTFDTKGRAKAWAEQRATELREQVKTGVDKTKTVADALARYAREVSSKKGGARWEQIRLNAFLPVELGEHPNRKPLSEIRLCEFTVAHYASFRDERLKTVSGSTVNREMNLLGHVFSIACDEWRWIAQKPTKGVKRPKEAPPRTRRVSDDEIGRVTYALGFDGAMANTQMQRAAVGFLFAIETAMRAGEMCRILRVKPKDGEQQRSASYPLSPRVVYLGKTKNGFAREVPLSPRAMELLNLLPMTGPWLFGFEDTRGLDALFRKGKQRAAIEDLHFHDTRHEAISRLAKKYQVLDLARIVGHRDLNELLTYYHTNVEALAAKLA